MAWYKSDPTKLVNLPEQTITSEIEHKIVRHFSNDSLYPSIGKILRINPDRIENVSLLGLFFDGHASFRVAYHKRTSSTVTCLIHLSAVFDTETGELIRVSKD